MRKKDAQETPLKSTEFPESAVERLANSLKIETDEAFDLIMFMYDEARRASGMP